MRDRSVVLPWRVLVFGFRRSSIFTASSQTALALAAEKSSPTGSSRATHLSSGAAASATAAISGLSRFAESKNSQALSSAAANCTLTRMCFS